MLRLIKCKNCETELSIMNIRSLRDIDFTRMGVYCLECFPAAESEIKAKRFVEEYKGGKIYSKDGKYAPYWHSNYCFRSLEDARKRLDNNHLAYFDTDMIGLLSQ